MCDDGDGDGDGISLSKSNPVQSGLSVWLNSSMARLNQYFFFSWQLPDGPDLPVLPYS